jgi:hypothetical protein
MEGEGETVSDKTLIEKIRSLPPDKVVEVEDFVDSLNNGQECRESVSEPSAEDGSKLEWKSLEGQWVAVQNELVVEHGSKLVDVVRRARARGIHKPYVFYVEPTGENVTKLGL